MHHAFGMVACSGSKILSAFSTMQLHHNHFVLVHGFQAPDVILHAHILQLNSQLFLGSKVPFKSIFSKQEGLHECFLFSSTHSTRALRLFGNFGIIGIRGIYFISRQQKKKIFVRVGGESTIFLPSMFCQVRSVVRWKDVHIWSNFVHSF